MSQTRQLTRIGIYGGAFDPPHLAHLAIAQAATAQYGLHQLIVLPTGHAWHKNRPLSAAAHRITMAKLAFAELPQAIIDERETLRLGPTYTLDTLQELQTEHPDAQLFLIMGEDQLANFPQWHRHEDILQIATLLVALRADSMPAKAQNDLENEGKITHLTIHMPASPISATQARMLCSQNQSLDHLVKPAVARYIADHRLYKLR